jgi:hypothetical protein
MEEVIFIVVFVVKIVLLDEVDERRRDWGVGTWSTGESEGAVGVETGDCFEDANKSRSSRSIEFVWWETGSGSGTVGFTGDVTSTFVRFRFEIEVFNDEFDVDLERCFRTFDDERIELFGGWSASVSLIIQFFSVTLIRSYSASDTKDVNCDFFFATGN